MGNLVKFAELFFGGIAREAIDEAQDIWQSFKVWTIVLVGVTSALLLSGILVAATFSETLGRGLIVAGGGAVLVLGTAYALRALAYVAAITALVQNRDVLKAPLTAKLKYDGEFLTSALKMISGIMSWIAFMTIYTLVFHVYRDVTTLTVVALASVGALALALNGKFKGDFAWYILQFSLVVVLMLGTARFASKRAADWMDGVRTSMDVAPPAQQEEAKSASVPAWMSAITTAVTATNGAQPAKPPSVSSMTKTERKQALDNAIAAANSQAPELNVGVMQHLPTAAEAMAGTVSTGDAAKPPVRLATAAGVVEMPPANDARWEILHRHDHK